MSITTDHLPQALDEKTKRQIANAVAEVDPAQMAITRNLTPAQRFQQMLTPLQKGHFTTETRRTRIK